jgi:5-methylcytosine-specific restriction enzyme subunit McrC
MGFCTYACRWSNARRADRARQLIRGGFDRGYVSFEETSRRLRGKVLLVETLQRSLLEQGRVACQIDELSQDVPHNRVIKAAMLALATLPGIDRDIAAGLRDHCRRLDGVADVQLLPSAFRKVQLHRNLARYAFLVNIAQLVAQSFIPQDKTGGRRFHPFTANEQGMGRLFQLFVRKFLEREQSQFKVDAPKVPWDLGSGDGSDVAWLPEMNTDVTLTNESQRVVIETKYYATPYQSRHGSKTLISHHLYQLLTYLSQLRASNGPEPIGVLLYARVGVSQRLRYSLGGHTVFVRTLDLDRDWNDIHGELLEMVRGIARTSEPVASA